MKFKTVRAEHNFRDRLPFKLSAFPNGFSIISGEQSGLGSTRINCCSFY